ncbi:golvesin C-terminal-like domain-containing protein [Streptomyces sp. NPDC002671]
MASTLHQIGGGYGGHFWYAHTRDTAHLGGTTNGPLTVRGSWIPNGTFDIAEVYVHVPDTGAQSQRAHYEISGAVGGPYDRYVDQDGNNNRWVSLGAFKFNGTPSVSLSNYTPTGSADRDIAFGAVAFQSVQGTFVHRTLTAASVFDPNQELNSNWPVSQLNTPIRSMKDLYNWGTELSHGTDGGPLWDGSASNEVSASGLTSWPKCMTEANKDECTAPKTYDAGEQWYHDIKERCRRDVREGRHGTHHPGQPERELRRAGRQRPPARLRPPADQGDLVGLRHRRPRPDVRDPRRTGVRTDQAPRPPHT